MTDLKTLFDKIAALPPRRRARVEKIVDALSPDYWPEAGGGDFRAELEALLGRPLLLINAVDLHNGDFAPAYARPPRSKRGH